MVGGKWLKKSPPPAGGKGSFFFKNKKHINRRGKNRLALGRRGPFFFHFLPEGICARPTRTWSHATYRRCLDPTKNLQRCRARRAWDLPTRAKLAVAHGCPPRSLHAKTSIKKSAIVLSFRSTETRVGSQRGRGAMGRSVLIRRVARLDLT